MPGKKHVAGVGPKEERMYEHIKERAEKSGRYGNRAKEVAARTVLKHHTGTSFPEFGGERDQVSK
jgi:hypothetical protein